MLIRAGSVAKSVDSVMEEVQRVMTEKVGAPEVQEQVDAWRNRFIFRFTNDFYSVSRLMSHELDERPYDRDQEVLAAIQKVTVDDVHRVARKHLKPESLAITIFGKLTDEDRTELTERFGLTAYTKEQVFTGGYDETSRPATVPTPPAATSAEQEEQPKKEKKAA